MICSFGTDLVIQQKSLLRFLPMHLRIHSKPSPWIPRTSLNQTQAQNLKRKPRKAQSSQQETPTSKASPQKNIRNKKTLNRETCHTGQLENVRYRIRSAQSIQKHSLRTIYNRHKNNKNLSEKLNQLKQQKLPYWTVHRNRTSQILQRHGQNFHHADIRSTKGVLRS